MPSKNPYGRAHQWCACLVSGKRPESGRLVSRAGLGKPPCRAPNGNSYRLPDDIPRQARRLRLNSPHALPRPAHNPLRVWLSGRVGRAHGASPPASTPVADHHLRNHHHRSGTGTPTRRAGSLLLGWGRDFSGVSPVRGVSLGGGDYAVSVSVDLEPVEGKETE